MRLPRAIWIYLALALACAAVFILISSRTRPPVVVRLWDGSAMRLIQTDEGRNLCYGGAGWQRLLYKTLGIRLRIGNYPSVERAVYTNGIALLFRRDVEIMAPNDPTQAWNNSGNLLLVNATGAETLARIHTVCWNADIGKPNMVGEELWFEIPLVTDRQLHLRLRETNRVTGLITTNDFWMMNPAM